MYGLPKSKLCSSSEISYLLENKPESMKNLVQISRIIGILAFHHHLSDRLSYVTSKIQLLFFLILANISDFLPLLCNQYADRGFPGGAVVENLPANAGDTGSSPGLGGSHMLRSSWACEPKLLSLRVWSLRSETREAAIVRGPRTAMKSGPRLPQLEKALAQKRRPSTAINK